MYPIVAYIYIYIIPLTGFEPVSSPRKGNVLTTRRKGRSGCLPLKKIAIPGSHSIVDYAPVLLPLNWYWYFHIYFKNKVHLPSHVITFLNFIQVLYLIFKHPDWGYFDSLISLVCRLLKHSLSVL